MSLLRNEERVQADRFEAACIQYREIHAGPHLLIKDFITQPDPLPCGFKTGRGLRINDVLLLQSFIDSCSLRKHAVGVFGLVGVKRRIARPLLQKLHGACNDLADCRVIRRNESRQQLRENAVPVPFVKRQNGNRKVLGTDNFLFRAEFNREIPGDFLRQTGQILRIHDDINVFDLNLRFRRNDADDLLIPFAESR